MWPGLPTGVAALFRGPLLTPTLFSVAASAAHLTQQSRQRLQEIELEEDEQPELLFRGPRSTRFPNAPQELAYIPKILCDRPGKVERVDSLEQVAPGELLIKASGAAVRIHFVTDGIMRIQMAPTGQFEDFTGNDLFAKKPDEFRQELDSHAEESRPEFTRMRRQFRFTYAGMAVVGQLEPFRLALHRLGEREPLWQEAKPMEWDNTSTKQSFLRSDNERFYGCGMQNGFQDHTGRVVPIEVGGGWDEGGRANPVPFFMSSKGYGVMRNTFSPGTYSFLGLTSVSHDDHGLDSFYFVSDSMKGVLQLYTSLVGRPFLPPIWGLWLGDSDCYNNERHGYNTSTALDIAGNYTEHRMPRGWMMINDGYGCGYTSREMLQDTQTGLQTHGIQMGLWTSTGLGNATWEISQGGSRAIKTDVAWVGAGYRFGLIATRKAASLMEQNSDSRPFTWTVCGWAGTQRYAVIWTGDNEGSWEYIRMQIPTVSGSGMSGFAHASGDIDGIFGGSPETYVRDLQWKTFLTAAMTMSGWAPSDKQPWVFGNPYTSYNRRALRLRARLTPYLYTLSWEAHMTGVPPARAMVLEFPDEDWPSKADGTPVTLDYQFMSGPFFLVAPVFRNETTRDNITLPSGEWIDYSNGERYVGPQVIDQYPAPLNKVPVFVRAGAIIPMWPLMQYIGSRLADPITLDIYPKAGDDGNTTSDFSLHEDDGMTRDHESGKFATQLFQLQAPTPPDFAAFANESAGSTLGSIAFRIGECVGEYGGKPITRGYSLRVHAAVPVAWATLDGVTLERYNSSEELDASPSPGWAQQPEATGYLVIVKTGSLGLDREYHVILGEGGEPTETEDSRGRGWWRWRH